MRPKKHRPEEGEPELDVREAAVRLLARREHSRRELAAKLRSRGAEGEAIDEVLEALAREGLQSDARFAESYTHSRRERGYGPLRIRGELNERGVDDALIEEALAAFDDWERLGEEVRLRKFGRRPPRDWPERAKQMRFLQYRGFAAEQIRAALDAETE